MRPIDRRSMLLGLAGLPVALATASCGLELTRPPIPPSGVDIAPADPATLRQGGVLRWSLDELPVNFNYNQADMTGYTASVVGAMMPFTYHTSPHADFILNTDYFTDISLQGGASPKTVVFTINPKAHWSDGAPITWEDLRAQWRACSGQNPLYQVVSTVGYENIAEVRRGVDDRQAVVTFKTPYADWKGLFSFLYPKATNSDSASFNKGWIWGQQGALPPVTAGPFTFGSIDIGQKRLALVPDPNWWGRKPRLGSIVFIELAREAQMGALQNEEIDWVDLQTSPPNLAIAENTKGIAIRSGLSDQIVHLTFNGKPTSILTDLKLRQAIAKGIDRKKLAATLIGPLVKDPEPAQNMVCTQGIVGYEDHSAARPFDPQAARAELDALGWTQKGQFREKDGTPLSVRFVIPAQTASSADMGKLVQQMLREIGVELIINSVSSSGFFRDYINVGDFDLTTFRWEFSASPGSLASIYTLRFKSDGTVNVQQNFGQIGSEELNNLIDRMLQALDPDEERRLVNEIDLKIAQLVHSLPVYQVPLNYAVRSDLKNFGPAGYQDMDYTAIGYARWPAGSGADKRRVTPL